MATLDPPAQPRVPIPSALITGGLGFLGSHIITSLSSTHPECQIHILDLQAPSPSQLSNPRITHHQFSLTSPPSDLHALIHSISPAVIIHSASHVPPLSQRYVSQPSATLTAVNITATATLLSAATACAATEAFVYTSSVHTLFDDLFHDYLHVDETVPFPPAAASVPYGASKAAAERLVLAASTATNPSADGSLKTCALRPTGLIGEGDHTIIPSLHRCIARHETPFHILGLRSDPYNLCEFSYAGDVADAHVLAAENLIYPFPTSPSGSSPSVSDADSGFGSAASSSSASSSSAAASPPAGAFDASADGEALFVSTREPVPFRHFCLAVWKEFGHYPPYNVRVPFWMGWWVGVVMEGWAWARGWEEGGLCRGTVCDAGAGRYVDGGKAGRVLGWRARVGLEEGIRRGCAAVVAERKEGLVVGEEKVG